jgi:hypothetical protein
LIGASPERINKMWEAQIKKAEEGDLYAFNAIMDRLEGKPVQATEISGPDGNDIQLSIPVHFIKPKDES